MTSANSSPRAKITQSSLRSEYCTLTGYKRAPLIKTRKLWFPRGSLCARARGVVPVTYGIVRHWTIPGTIRGRLGGQNSQLAVESKVFPLYEVENGEKWNITVWLRREVPVREYLKLQGRFSHLTEEDIEFIQENVDREWERLVGRAGR